MQLLEREILKKTSNNGKALSNIPSNNSDARGEGVMVNKQVRKIVIHLVKPSESDTSIPDKINELHVEIINRRLEQNDLTAEQKIAVIDQIIENLKSSETAGIIT
jgi:hypothetical protein